MIVECICNGTRNGEYKKGEGIVISKAIKKSVLNIIAISEGIISIQIDSKIQSTYIIQVYAPTTRRRERRDGNFYSELDEMLNKRALLPKINNTEF